MLKQALLTVALLAAIVAICTIVVAGMAFAPIVTKVILTGAAALAIVLILWAVAG